MLRHLRFTITGKSPIVLTSGSADTLMCCQGLSSLLFFKISEDRNKRSSAPRPKAKDPAARKEAPQLCRWRLRDNDYVPRLCRMFVLRSLPAVTSS
jgi:hypothetical protein